METSFDFKAGHVLEDDVVLLRPLEEQDAEHLIDFSLNQPDLWTYSVLQPVGHEMLKKYISVALQERQDEKGYPFIVYDKRSKQYAGSTRFYNIQLPNNSLEIGYTWYGKQFQGTGLNIHCKFLLLSFAFEKMKMVRVGFIADNRNERSIAAMKSIGCVVEGVMRKNILKPDGLHRDTIVLSILDEEWVGSVKANLAERIKSKR